MRGAVDSLQGRHVIKRDFDRLEERAWAKLPSSSPSARCCTWVRVIPDMSTDWNKNSLRADLWRRIWIFH